MINGMAVQILILILLLGVAPLLAGGIFVPAGDSGKNIPLRWVSGQFLFWAGFQILCVPLVLAPHEKSFWWLCVLFGGFMAGAVLLSLGLKLRRRKRDGQAIGADRRTANRSAAEKVFWLIFWGLLLFQLIQAVRMTYGDGDDAFYVAIASMTASSGDLYRTMPYTGLRTGLSVRYGLAPFPVWIAFLSRISGMSTAMVAHVVLPVTLISMTYVIFYMIGGRLFSERGEKLPLFLIFTEILVLFGDYSVYTPENFMIARSRQGKAALCSLVIPFVLYLLLVWVQRLQESRKIPFSHYVLLGVSMLAGCLCSTLGAALVCMLAGGSGVMAAVCCRKKYALLPVVACCIPCVVYVCLYLVMS